MTVERYVDPEIFEAVIRESRAAYRAAVDLVAPQITALVAGAGQTISDAEWEALTLGVSDAQGDGYMDAVIAAAVLFGVLPTDDQLAKLIVLQENAMNDLASAIRASLDEFTETIIEDEIPSDLVLDLLLDSPMSPLNPRKADVLARTSTTASINAGFDASFQASGVAAKSWITQRDDRVREAHVAVDRDVVPIGGLFNVGGFDARFPGDPQLPIELKINCRCLLGWVDGDQVKQAVDATKKALYKTARQLNIPGRSRMNKPALQLAVINSLCLQGLAAGSDCPDVLDDMNMATLLTYARIAEIRGRYRMRRPELLDAVKTAFTVSTAGVGFATTVGDVLTVSSLSVLADDVINGDPVSVGMNDAADLVEILGRHPEPVDLTLVRVTEEFFTGVSRNPLTRDEMPQIPENFIEDFQSYIEGKGATVTLESVDPLDVLATQSELDARKVGKMVAAIRNGQFTPEHPAFVSSDGRILDGHHRWAAQVLLNLAGGDQMMVAARASVDMDTLLEYAYDFAELHDIESKSHGMSWDVQQRHARGSFEGGRWRSHYDSSGRPRRTFDVGVRPSIFDPDQARRFREERSRIRTYEREHRLVETPNREQLERHKDQFGKGLDAIFAEGGVGVTTVPFRSASRTKGAPLYDKAVVAEALARPPQLSAFDPRTLHATQPGVTREGVDYYMNDPTYQSVGETFADRDQPGNQYPVIYRNPANGQHIILSGHHRATAALLSGRPLEGILVDPRIRVVGSTRRAARRQRAAPD